MRRRSCSNSGPIGQSQSDDNDTNDLTGPEIEKTNHDNKTDTIIESLNDCDNNKITIDQYDNVITITTPISSDSNKENNNGLNELNVNNSTLLITEVDNKLLSPNSQGDCHTDQILLQSEQNKMEVDDNIDDITEELKPITSGQVNEINISGDIKKSGKEIYMDPNEPVYASTKKYPKMFTFWQVCKRI